VGFNSWHREGGCDFGVLAWETLKFVVPYV
jgi:hypothetical protein